jgi:trimethylguanosine synthase
MSRDDAADVVERFRNVGLGGATITVTVDPPLPRAVVREARLRAARRRRDKTPAFLRAGTRLDTEGKLSLTPEPIAMALARRVKGARVVDACAGCGGNAIAFARAGCETTAIEIDTARLGLAKRNARVYGVERKIRFVHGDTVSLVAELTGDLLFVDPPWGGAGYDRLRTTLDDVPLVAPILAAARGRFGTTWLKLPPSFDVAELPDAKAEAVFGEASGDRDRVKFLLLALGAVR